MSDTITQQQNKDALAAILLEDSGTNTPVSGSLANKIAVQGEHANSRGFWFGVATTPVSGVTEAQVGGTTPFQSIIGSGDTWSAWVPIFGTDDEPEDASYEAYHITRMLISQISANDKNPHLVQIVWGEDTAELSLAAKTETGFMTIPEKDGKSTPATIQIPVIEKGKKLWLRHRVAQRNTPWGDLENTMSFFIGMHEHQDF